MRNTWIQEQAKRQFGLNLKKARKASGKSVKECSEVLGISKKRYEAFEMGEEIPSLPVLESVSFYFDFPIEFFFTGESTYLKKREKVEQNLERFITQMSPRLILDNRRSIRYRGVYAFYRLGGKRYFYLYYDMRKSPRDLPRDFITLLSPDGQIEVEEFGFIFLVPDTPDRSIISLNFSVPGYEPLPTEKPLSCSLRRRYRPRRHIRERG